MRIFAFGCSLSQYFFPTWADILIHQYKNKGYQGENWAKSGAGNQYINTRLWEANTVHKFNKEDIIKENEEIVVLESVKATDSIKAPFDCVLIENNDEVENNQEQINKDPENTWIIKISEHEGSQHLLSDTLFSNGMDFPQPSKIP